MEKKKKNPSERYVLAVLLSSANENDNLIYKVFTSPTQSETVSGKTFMKAIASLIRVPKFLKREISTLANILPEFTRNDVSIIAYRAGKYDYDHSIQEFLDREESADVNDDDPAVTGY